MKRALKDSESIQKAAAKKLSRDLLIVEGIGKPRFVILKGKELDKLGVDERYQRVRVTEEVNTLIHVLTAGGDIPDPIKVAEREDGSWWIVDGQQRFWAHSETKKPLKAMIYSVPDFDTECRMFVALNTSVAVKPEYVIKASPGETAELLREVNTDPEHSLHGKLSFKPGAVPFGVSVLVRAICFLLTGSAHARAIGTALQVTDKALRQHGAKAKARAYLQLVGEVRENGKKQLLQEALAFAQVCRARWKDSEPEVPNGRAMGGLKRIHFEQVTHGHALKYLPMIVAEIEARWAEKD